MEVPISKEVIQTSRGTTAVKDEGGRLHISFVIIEGGMPVQYTFITEEPGQKNIMDAMSGGLQVADLSDLAKLKAEAEAGKG
jgi:hypothetical protein